MDKTIVTAMLIVISMVMALMLFNVAYPAVMEGGDAITGMAVRAEGRMKTQITFIHAAATGSQVSLWVKNTGAVRISAVEQSDIFFGPEGSFARIPHESQAGGSYPYWTWQIENAAEWSPTATLHITIHYASALPSGRYFAKITVPSGVSDDYFLGV